MSRERSKNEECLLHKTSKNYATYNPSSPFLTEEDISLKDYHSIHF